MKERWVRIIPYLSFNSIINSYHLHQLLSKPQIHSHSARRPRCNCQHHLRFTAKRPKLGLTEQKIWFSRIEQFNHPKGTSTAERTYRRKTGSGFLPLVSSAQAIQARGFNLLYCHSHTGPIKADQGCSNSAKIGPEEKRFSYAKLRMIESGFDVCQYLGEHGFTLSVISYNTLINVAQKCDHISLVWKIYEHMIEKRTYPNDVTVKIMISALCKEGKLQEFLDMVDRIHGKRSSPTVIVNTSLVFRILEEGRVEEGLVLLKRILQKNMILDTISFSLIVYAKVKIGGSDSAWEVYEEMLKRGFHANPFVYTLFIGAYCKEGRVEGAIRLMQEMEDAESVKFCEKTMEMGFVPSCSAFNEMIGKLFQTGGVKQANDMLTDLLDKGFEPDSVTYSRLIAGYAKEGNIQEVLKLYYEMESKLISPGSSVFASLVSILCQYGRLDESERYLKVMKDRSIPPCSFVYETLISSHHKKGNKARANQLYSEMAGEGLKPCSQICCVGAENL
ncbi:hypothetical protein Acr_00g0063470 [Actinidia rufa]|uniref:Tetratricopeptide repeat (TPR)-like superfamily protein n=1 Tax=Actinidia rufa TaxID=165716 RepID=A0A7J0DPG3_9ERIC|nr:hypothetical protein Acr_00g0063470 [Actinidia rufa]